MHNPCDTCICRNISFLLEHHKCDPDLQFLTLEQSPSSLPGFKNLTFDSVYGIILYTHLSVTQRTDQSVVSNTQVLGRCHTTCKAIGAFPNRSEMFWAYLTLHPVLSGEIHPSGQAFVNTHALDKSGKISSTTGSG